MTETRTTKETCEAASTAVSDTDDIFLLDESGRPIADENGRLITIERDEQLRFLTEKM